MNFRAITVSILLTISLPASCEKPAPYYAFIDHSGRIRIRFAPSQQAQSFSDGLAAVSVNDRWGFINVKGEFVISPQFGAAKDFSEGTASVTPASPAEYRNRNALFGYIDRSGRFVIPPQFSSASSFSEKLAAVCRGNDNRGSARYGYIDQRGHYVVPPRFTRTCPFSEGLACASVETGMLAPQGYIDKTGKFIIQPRFQFARNFANGLASTLDGYIDRAGQVIIPAQSVVESGDFAEGLARTSQNNKEVFVDTAGKVKLQPGYEGVGGFSEGLAPACKSDCNMSGGDESWGFMDKAGKFVIPARFGYKPSSFHDGLALVCFGCTG